MRSLTACVGLLSVVAVSIIGCTTGAYIAGSRKVNMVAAIESNGVQQTLRLTQEGLVTAIAGQGRALAEFAPKWDLYRMRMALLLEPGKSEGETVCELEETYRVVDDGIYAVRLEGVVESGLFPVDTIESGLEVSIEVRSSIDNSVVGQMHKKVRPRVFTVDGPQRFWLSPVEELDPLTIEIKTGIKYRVRSRVDNSVVGQMHKKIRPRVFTVDDPQRFWLSPVEELDPLTIEMKAGINYLVYTRIALFARSESWSGNTPMSIDGEFQLIVEPIDRLQTREEHTKSLALKLIELWTVEDAKLAEDPQLKDAAYSLAELFLGEAARYVDIHIPQHNRFACFEHARIVREWYETRMRLDPNLARWFCMTTIRRNTLFLWQSSNLITPNVSDPPDRWLDDGTGIVLELKYGVAGNFYGRYISAKEFCSMGFPEIQQVAQTPFIER